MTGDIQQGRHKPPGPVLLCRSLRGNWICCRGGRGGGNVPWNSDLDLSVLRHQDLSLQHYEASQHQPKCDPAARDVQQLSETVWFQWKKVTWLNILLNIGGKGWVIRRVHLAHCSIRKSCELLSIVFIIIICETFSFSSCSIYLLNILSSFCLYAFFSLHLHAILMLSSCNLQWKK